MPIRVYCVLSLSWIKLLVSSLSTTMMATKWQKWASNTVNVDKSEWQQSLSLTFCHFVLRAFDRFKRANAIRYEVAQEAHVLIRVFSYKRQVDLTRFTFQWQQSFCIIFFFAPERFSLPDFLCPSVYRKMSSFVLCQPFLTKFYRLTLSRIICFYLGSFVTRNEIYRRFYQCDWTRYRRLI